MSILVFALTTVNTDDLEALGMYLGITKPLLESAGAEIIQGYEISETLIGPDLADMVTIVRYPDRDAIDRVFQSSEYQSLKNIRERAFLSYQIGVVQE